MKDYSEKDHRLATSDPASLLQAAIEQIEVFTKQDVARLEVQEDGKLIAAPTTGTERIVGLVRHFIGPIFSEQLRIEQEQKLNQIKQKLLNARDIIQSHSLLIEKLKAGNSAQQKLANWSLEAIKRYNEIVNHSATNSEIWSSRYQFYNYERNQLLLDEDIKGKEIRLPQTISISFDSHSDNHPAQKTFKELSATFATQKDCSTLFLTHKESAHFMIDTFCMKAIRSIQTHLSQHSSSISEIRSLVRQTPIEIDEDFSHQATWMRQVLEIAPGTFITLTGSFKKGFGDSKLMKMPTLEDWRFNLESTQTGFPYPSQHTGWVLANELTTAELLRPQQVPLFYQLEQKKNRIAQDLLFNSAAVAKAKNLFKMNKEVFDRNRDIFLNLYRQLQESILQAASKEEEIASIIFNQFFALAKDSDSPFDFLVKTQQKFIQLFIALPAKKLQDAWLNGMPELRNGNSDEKLLMANDLLTKARDQAKLTLNKENYLDAFIDWMESFLGPAFQSIILQYMSEKIGFAPLMLNNFEHKVQTCAFQQLLTFLDEIEDNSSTNALSESESLERLQNKMQTDLNIFKVDTIETLDTLSAQLTIDLEAYFNARFHKQNT